MSKGKSTVKSVDFSFLALNTVFCALKMSLHECYYVYAAVLGNIALSNFE